MQKSLLRFGTKFRWVTVLGYGLIAHPSAAADSSARESIFDPNHLIQIEIRLASQDWQAMRISHRVQNETVQFADKPYEYYRADLVIDGREVRSVGVRKKGFLGSVVSTRPSLKIKFDEYVKDQEFGGVDMMTLNNDNQDATHAQQLMSYNFMNAAGVVAPRCSLARVTVNGEDLGIYSHVESIRKPFIKQHFQKANGDLYEGYAGDFTTNEVIKIVHKWGKDDEREHLQPLVELLQQSGPVPVAEVEKRVDLDGFIALWASEVLLGHWDGYSGNRNNWYLYRDKETEKLHFIPWGADSVFNDPGIFINYPVPKSVKAVGLLCRRLWEVPEIRTRYRAELQRQLNEAWKEDILLAQLDRALWMGAKYRPPDDRSAAETAAVIRKFVASRRTEIQAELDGPTPDWPENPYASPVTGPPTMMNVSGSFSTVMQERLPARKDGNPLDMTLGIPFGEGSAKLAYKIGEKTHAPFTRYGVQAFPDSPMPIRRGYPCIQLRTESDDGSRVWNLTLMLDPHQVETGANDLASDMFSVWTVISQGQLGTPGGDARFFGVVGKVKLDHFGAEPGARVSGTFDLWTPAFAEKPPVP